MALINVSNGNYLKIRNIQISEMDDSFKTVITYYLFKNKDQRIAGPAEFETFYEKQLETSEFIFVNDLDIPINNIKTGAYLTLRRNGFDELNWLDG